MSISAHPHGIVYQVAKVHSPVGSHGPALINLHWPNAWPGSHWGNGLDGNAGIYDSIEIVLTIENKTKKTLIMILISMTASNTKRDLFKVLSHYSPF